MSYLIWDEEGDLMRVVGRKEEAERLVDVMQLWTYTFVRNKPNKPDLSQFEDALI